VGFNKAGYPAGLIATIDASEFGTFNRAGFRRNNNGVLSTGSNLTGGYTIDSNFRVNLEFHVPFETQEDPTVISCYMTRRASRGYCVGQDGNGYTLGGLIERINSKANFSDFNLGHAYYYESKPVGSSGLFRLRETLIKFSAFHKYSS
jgi:hypothetical protein